MLNQVMITTGARLHFGLLAHAPAAKRQFGGVGLMIESPGFCLSVASGGSSLEGDVYLGPAVWQERVLEVVARCRQLGGDKSVPYSTWTLHDQIPAHAGLGSGTQLALAVTRACWALTEATCPDSTTLARLAGRGLRSALGIHGFEQGGLLVEGGKRETDQVSPAITRLNWPDRWRILLVRPRNVAGLCGTSEVQAFSTLAPMAVAVSARLCQLTLLELLPAVTEGDFETTSEALFEFGRLVGDYFAPVQGGTYSTPQIRQLVGHLRERGIRGVGQSSWGPTAFIMCSNLQMADELQRDLLRSHWGDCDIRCVAAKNEGAKIEVT